MSASPRSSSAIFFASTMEEVERVAKAMERAGERGEVVGLDTEFYGVEIGKESCYTKAQVHLVSVAVQRYPLEMDVRGLPICDAAVATRDCLGNGRFVQMVQASGLRKAVHNLPVDAHALANHGIILGGGINTLALARWCWPERARGRGFTLDSLGEDFLRSGKTESYDDIFTEEYEALRSTFRTIRVCECGTPGCRKRQSTPGHQRRSEQVETVHASIKTRPVPLASVGPGHPLWDRAVAYSARDAVMALQIYNLAMSQMSETQRIIPWL